MDNMKFYEYVFTILSEAGHVITSSRFVVLPAPSRLW